MNEKHSSLVSFVANIYDAKVSVSENDHPIVDSGCDNDNKGRGRELSKSEDAVVGNIWGQNFFSHQIISKYFPLM